MSPRLARLLLMPIAMIVAVVMSAVVTLAAENIDFAKDIGPLLAKRCAGCHDATEKKGGLDLSRRETLLAGGESGVALVPGKAAESLVWQRVEADEMPPKHPLSAAEKKLLQAWIAAGAPWTGDALDPLAYTTEHRAGYDWWSLQPLQPVKVPPLSARAHNAIDAFVEQRLAAAKLTPSPPADARTLIRRLHFDLLGLPPTAEEVNVWEQKRKAESGKQEDPRTLRDSAALSFQLSALLASPHYGERWARHWLDIVRFGESQGFERDKLRTNSWRYRDWVIAAFNNDLPYDEFARLQLAGDVLRPGDADALIATGFLVAAPWDEVGQKQQSAAMRAVVRQDELEDLVGTVGQTFLGLTVNCGRCHDHKFDPVRQREYYQLCAALAGVRHGEPTAQGESLVSQASRLKQPSQQRIAALDRELAALETPHRQRILAAHQTAREKVTPPAPIVDWQFKRGTKDTVSGLELELLPGAYIRGGQLLLEGEGYALSPPVNRELREKTLVTTVVLTDLDQRGGAALTLQTLDGQKFDAIVFGEREPRHWLAGSDHFTRTQNVAGLDESLLRKPVQIAITYAADGTIAIYRNGQPYGKPYRSRGLQTFAADKFQVLVGLRHLPNKPERRLKCAVERASIFDRALTSAEVAALAGVDPTDVPETELLAALSASERERRTQIRFERDQLLEALQRVDDRKVYAVAAQKPEPTHVLNRGNANEPQEAVSAGGIQSLRGLSADFQLPLDANDADRRRRLAEWITSRDNPLFARVMVNRLWQYHFGVGLVETPNDFGFNGGRPSHPELLDWLAGELIANKWSLKHIQRLIVSSATYQQASTWREDAAKIDAGNRLLWRRSPQRLEAETLRDTLLAIAGRLDTTSGGPGFYEFSTFFHNSQFYVMQDAIGSTFERRTIYRTWVRSARSNLLDAFDCPDPSTRAPQRAVTTTPLQALSLANNSFVLRLAESLAERIHTDDGDAPETQVRGAFRRVFQRSPQSDELAVCVKLVENHGLAALCRALFNSNELLYVD